MDASLEIAGSGIECSEPTGDFLPVCFAPEGHEDFSLHEIIATSSQFDHEESARLAYLG